MKHRIFKGQLLLACCLCLAGCSSPMASEPKMPSQEETSAPGDTSSEQMALPETYDEVLNQYILAIQQEWDPGQFMEHSMSYVLCPSYGFFPEGADPLTQVGYCFLDVDQNGTKELLLGFASQAEPADNCIYDLYATTEEGIRQVFYGWERNSYALGTEGRIWNRGSNGASDSVYFWYVLEEDGSLKALEGVICRDGRYYYSHGSLEQSGGQEISQEAFEEYLAHAESQLTALEFTPLSQYSP